MNDGRILRASGWALLWSLCLAALPAAAAPRYTLIDTATLIPGHTFQAAALNDRGALVGTRGDGHAVIVTPGQGEPIDIGTLPSQSPGFETRPVPVAINNFGQVTGTVYYNTDENDPPVIVRGFLYTPGVGMTDIGLLPTQYLPTTYGVDINDRGVVLAMSVGGTRWETITFSLGRGLEVLPTALDVQPEGINDRGQILGSLLTGTQLASYIYDRGAVTQLQGSGAAYVYAYDINDRGWVTGGMSRDRVRGQAFLYKPGTGIVDLMARGANDGFINTYGVALNNRGQVVGSGWDGRDTAGFYYDKKTGIVRLSKLVEPADMVGWRLWDGFAINNRGQILAYGLRDGSNVTTVVLLTPVKKAGPDHDHDHDDDDPDHDHDHGHGHGHGTPPRGR
ncbi:hypothetical protein [Rhizobacter sp. LjRoot28]|uniref:hypothetical protein n=1 Tax=Rhizobacter sp. LjRoot28 TaxID=3342309 RepID=UPI003ECE7B25